MDGPGSRTSATGEARPAETASCVYDLRTLAAADRVWKLPRLAIALAILGSMGAAVAALWSSAGLSGSTHDGILPDLPVRWLLTAGFAGLIAASLGGILRLRSGALALSIDGEGLHLTYAGGQRELIPWSDRRGWTLHDLSHGEATVPPSLDYQFHRSAFWARRTLLTRPAFDSVLGEARHRPLAISVRPGSPSGPGFAPVTFRIRPATGPE